MGYRLAPPEPPLTRRQKRPRHKADSHLAFIRQLPCLIEGCGKRRIARGWCAAHYSRWRIHGDPLGGGTLHGEPMRFLREVALAYDGEECLPWPFARSSAGYGRLCLDGEQMRVHRIVCEHRHGPPPTPEHEAAHSCGRGHEGCVTPRHLRWATSAENKADTLTHNTRARGERHGMAKLTEADVFAIRALRGQASQTAIAARFGVSRQLVSDIQRGERWAWLTGAEP